MFYRDPATNDYLKRATAYSDAMGKLYQQYPTDLEAGAFYALSLLASAPPGDTSLAVGKEGGRGAQPAVPAAARSSRY